MDVETGKNDKAQSFLKKKEGSEQKHYEKKNDRQRVAEENIEESA